MSSNSNVDNPPSRGAKVLKALVLLAVGIKILTGVAPNHGPIFGVFAILMVIGGVINLIIAILA